MSMNLNLKETIFFKTIFSDNKELSRQIRFQGTNSYKYNWFESFHVKYKVKFY